MEVNVIGYFKTVYKWFSPRLQIFDLTGSEFYICEYAGRFRYFDGKVSTVI